MLKLLPASEETVLYRPGIASEQVISERRYYSSQNEGLNELVR